MAKKKKPSLKVGDKVKLRNDVLIRHARSKPASAGYTKAEFEWRQTLQKLKGKVGTVERVFPTSGHVNVRFGKTLIGIDSSELIKVSGNRKKKSKKNRRR